MPSNEWNIKPVTSLGKQCMLLSVDVFLNELRLLLAMKNIKLVWISFTFFLNFLLEIQTNNLER